MNILVRLPPTLGPVVMSMGFVRMLLRLEPAARIDVIAEEDLVDLVRMFPHIGHVYPYSKKQYKGLKGNYRFARSLRKKSRYHVFFSLPDSFSSAWMGFFLSSKRKVGYRKQGRSFLLTHGYNKPKGLHRAEEYVHLLRRYFKHPALPQIDTSLPIPAFEKRYLPKGKNVVVHFSSEASSRALPVDKAISVLQALGLHLEAQFTLVGIRKDATYNESICKAMPADMHVQNLAGKTSMCDLLGVLGEADLVLSTDSGPAHLANSLGKRLVVFMGAGDEHRTRPYMARNLRLLRAPDIPCAPCQANICRYGEPHCLVAIETARVLQAVDELWDIQKTSPLLRRA